MSEAIVEEWRVIEGFPNYEVSDHGRVRSWSNCQGGRRAAPRMLKFGKGNDGYSRVGLCNGGKAKTRLVSNLVAEAFIGPKPEGMEVCHDDGSKSNSRKDNLRYDTHKKNEADKVRHGTTNRGSRNGNAKLTESAVHEIRRLLSDGWDRWFIGRLFGISQRVIRSIRTGETWGHLPNLKESY